MIVRYTGGLGNQLFQYAFGKMYAIEHGCDLEFDSFSYVRDKKRNLEICNMSISNKKCITGISVLFYNALFYLKFKSNRYFFKEKESFVYQDIDIKESKKYFLGDWQNVKYFNDIRRELQAEFDVVAIPETIKIIKREIDNCINSVAVHVRRGDYLHISGYTVQGKEYFEAAMNHMEARMQNPTFYIFSDDIAWCELNLKNPGRQIIFVQDNSAIEDFILMRSCKNFIISNSTFSWWAAYLRDAGIKIAPEKWFTDRDSNIKVVEALLHGFEIM